MRMTSPLPALPVEDATIRAVCKPGLTHIADGEPRLLAMFASLDIVAHFLGKDWIAKAMGPRAKSQFLSLTEDDQEARFDARILDLAEMLLNFQSTTGFAARLQELRGLGVEEAVSELECAKYMIRLGWRYAYVARSKKRRFDYDMNVWLPCGTAAAVEIKCKMEETACSANTVTETIKKAVKKQFPNDRPCFLFMRIPRQWVEHEENQAVVVSGIDAALRTATRVTAVLWHWEVFGTLDGDRPSRSEFFNYRLNRAAAFMPSSIRDGLEEGPLLPWKQLHDVLPEVSGAVTRLIPRAPHVVASYSGEP